MIFVDTNYFLRFLLQDSNPKYLIVKKLFREAALGHVGLITTTLVFFETAWVLRKALGKDKQSLVTVLVKMANLKIDLENRTLILNALALYQNTNLSLEDCYNLVFAKSKKVLDFKTFDLKLQQAFTKGTNSYEG